MAPNRKYICGHCGATFTSSRSLTGHYVMMPACQQASLGRLKSDNQERPNPKRQKVSSDRFPKSTGELLSIRYNAEFGEDVTIPTASLAVGRVRTGGILPRRVDVEDGKARAATVPPVDVEPPPPRHYFCATCKETFVSIHYTQNRYNKYPACKRAFEMH